MTVVSTSLSGTIATTPLAGTIAAAGLVQGTIEGRMELVGLLGSGSHKAPANYWMEPGLAPGDDGRGRLKTWSGGVDALSTITDGIIAGTTATDPITAGFFHPKHAWPWNVITQQQGPTFYYPSWDNKTGGSGYNGYEKGWWIDEGTHVNGGMIVQRYSGLITNNNNAAQIALAIAPNFIATKTIGQTMAVGDFQAKDAVFVFPALGANFAAAPFTIDVCWTAHGTKKHTVEATLRVAGAAGAVVAYQQTIILDKFNANTYDWSQQVTLVGLFAIQGVAQNSGSFITMTQHAHLQTENNP